jgi:hypothetical protein
MPKRKPPSASGATHDATNTSLLELRTLAAGAERRRTETGIPRVAMVQGAIAEHELSAVYEPMVNLILQGSKSMTVGDRTLHYDPATYFVMSIDLPAVGAVRAAASGEPYLAVSLTLEPAIVASLLTDLDDADPGRDEPSGFSVAAITPELMDAWVRFSFASCKGRTAACCAPSRRPTARWHESTWRSAGSEATSPSLSGSRRWQNESP